MSRKSKKQSRKTSVVKTAPAVNNGSSVAASSISFGKAAQSEFNPDYSQTKKDLRRIGILASSFSVVLIILSFILR